MAEFRDILVTGGNGQVGLEMQALAWPDDIRIHVPARDELDITDPASVAAVFAAHSYAAVISPAAYTAVDKAEGDVGTAFAVKAYCPALPAQTTRTAGITLVQVYYVFNGSADRRYVETDPVGPLGVYGASKFAGELAVRSGNPRSVVMAWVLSRHRPIFLKAMLHLAETRSQLWVVAHQIGHQTSAGEIAKALASITLRMIDYTAAPTGIYHFVGGGETSTRDISARSAELGGVSAEVQSVTKAEYPTPAHRPAISRPVTAKLTEDYGIAPRPWQEGVKAIVQQLQSRRAPASVGPDEIGTTLLREISRRGFLAAGATMLASSRLRAQPPATSGPAVTVSGNILRKNGKEYRAVGCNFYDALNHADMEQRFRFLADNGVPFIRLDFGTYAVGSDANSGWRQYLTDKSAWYDLRDRCVEAAAAANIGLVANMFWHPYTVPALMTYRYSHPETLLAWAMKNSNTRSFMRDVAAEMADRYKNASAIWGWECTNELSNEVILACNKPSLYKVTQSRLNFDNLAELYSDWSKAVGAVDSSGRLVSSGDNLANYNMYGCATGSGLDPDTMSQWMSIPSRGVHLPGPMVLNPPDLNSISTHIYQHANVPGQWFRDGPHLGPAGLIALHKKIADDNNRIVFIGEFGSLQGGYGQDGEAGTDSSRAGEQKYYERTLDAIIASKIQLSAAWNYGYLVDTPTKRWNIDPGTPRDYVFRSIAEANARIRRELDAEPSEAEVQ
jgi:dTDP-4-dehydrorhamnose reductase